MLLVLILVHIAVCLALIFIVLLQQGKGSDIASAFGGGGGQAAFGARSGATFLHKLTVGAFVVFILTSIMLGIVNRREAPSIVDKVQESEAVEETSGEVEGSQDLPPVPEAAPAGEEEGSSSSTADQVPEAAE